MPGPPDLAGLEQILARDPADWRTWAVYADALTEIDARSPRAEAIRAALRNGPTTPGRPVPDGIEVAWWYGHWRAVRFAGPDPVHGELLRRVLRQPNARFVEHLLLPSGTEIDLAELPPTVRRLELEGRGELVLDGVGPLEVLSAPGVDVDAPGDLGGLQVLNVGALAELPERAERLRELTVRSVPLGRLVELPPEAVPALRTLALGRELEPQDLQALLKAPVARRLGQLEVAGPGLAEVADALRPLWEHLERMVVDDPELVVEGPHPGLVVGGPHPGPAGDRLVVRAPEEDDGDDLDRTLIRIAPPSTAVDLYRAVADACDALLLRSAVIRGEPGAAGIAVPNRVAQPLATWIATEIGLPVHVASGSTGTEHTPDGVVRPFATGWRVTLSQRHDADGGTSGFEAYDADRGEIEPDLSVVEDDTGEEDPFDSGEEGLDEPWEEYVGAVLEEVWVPAAWPPDPFPRARPPAHVPKRIVREGRAHALDADLGGYLWWRAHQAGVVREVQAPDLGRWTVRLLGRHRLEEAPADPDHPYWRDWREATARERTRRAGEHLAAHKLTMPGIWALDPDEVRMLTDALRRVPDGHRPPLELADRAAALEAALRGAHQVEIVVG